MAGETYHRGEMDIRGQKATWDGFITGSIWGMLMITLIVGHAILALALGVHWAVSLVLMAIVGVVAGLAMNLGGRWLAAVAALFILGLVVQAAIAIGGALI